MSKEKTSSKSLNNYIKTKLESLSEDEFSNESSEEDISDNSSSTDSSLTMSSSNNSSDIDTDDNISYDRLNELHINNKFTKIESDIIILEDNHNSKFKKLEQEILLLKQRLEEQEKMNIYKTIHFISRRNDFL
jgi:hypothetical protein